MSYHIYINNEFLESTKENRISLTNLKHDTDYLLRIVAVTDDEEIVAFADLSIAKRIEYGKTTTRKAEIIVFSTISVSTNPSLT